MVSKILKYIDAKAKNFIEIEKSYTPDNNLIATINVEEKYLKSTVKDFETAVLINHLIEIKLDESKTMESLINDNSKGYITNRKFRKVKINSKERSSIVIYCSCGKSLHKNINGKIAFGHKNMCNKNCEKISTLFCFKIKEEMKLSESKNSEKKKKKKKKK